MDSNWVVAGMIVGYIAVGILAGRIAMKTVFSFDPEGAVDVVTLLAIFWPMMILLGGFMLFGRLATGRSFFDDADDSPRSPRHGAEQ